jgi:hypothetical protein
MPGVSDLDYRTGFCQSVLVTWKETGKIPRQQAKGRESVVRSCCMSCYPIFHDEVILTWCKSATAVSWTPTFHIPEWPLTCHALVLKYVVVIPMVTQFLVFWLTTEIILHLLLVHLSIQFLELPQRCIYLIPISVVLMFCLTAVITHVYTYFFMGG